jgi:hypothetical protein
MLWVIKIKQNADTNPNHGKKYEATSFYGIWDCTMMWNDHTKLCYGQGWGSSDPAKRLSRNCKFLYGLEKKEMIR